MISYSKNPKQNLRVQSEGDTLIVSPELRYVLASNVIPILVCVCIPIFISYILSPTIRMVLYGLGALLLLYLVYVLYRAKTTIWTITDSQLIYRRGVFSISVDYMELYRVNDYIERMSFVGNLIGVKTIIIHSSDRTNGTLSLLGIDKNIDVVSVLRTNVEHSKTRRNVYEIANR